MRDHQVERSPAAGTADARLPAITRCHLGSGVHVWCLDRPTAPIATIVAVIRAGSADEPQGKDGLAAVTADMLLEGYQGTDAASLAREFETCGGTVQVSVRPDATVIRVSVLPSAGLTAARLVAEMIAHPSLCKRDFGSVRARHVARCVQSQGVPRIAATRHLRRLLFGESGYSHTALGTVRALTAMTIEDVHRFWHEGYSPRSTAIFVAGQCSVDGVVEAIGAATDGWSWRPASASANGARCGERGALVVLDRAATRQSEVCLGSRLPGRATSHYPSLLVATALLGGRFGSRLNSRLREEETVTYAAGAWLNLWRSAGLLAVRTTVEPNAIGLTLDTIRAEMRMLGVPEQCAALEKVKQHLTRGYARGFETSAQVALMASDLWLYDLPEWSYDTYVRDITCVTTEDIDRTVLRCVRPDDSCAVVVTDLSRVGELPWSGPVFRCNEQSSECLRIQ